MDHLRNFDRPRLGNLRHAGGERKMIAGMIVSCGFCLGGIMAGIIHDVLVTRKMEAQLNYVTGMKGAE